MGNPIRKLDRIHHYQVRGVLGQGSQGKVYMAQRPGADEPSAVKVLARDLTRHVCCVRCFERNAAAVSSIQHRNIARVHEVGTYMGRHYLARELVDGLNLRQFIEKRGPLDPSKALDMVSQVAAALHAAHSEGTVHGNLTPENVLLTKGGVVKLTDFGTTAGHPRHILASLVPGRHEGDTRIPAAIHPSPQGDLVRLGLLFHGMLVGRLPESPPPENAFLTDAMIGDVPEILQPILRQMAGPDGSNRIRTPASLVQALQDIELGEEEEHIRTVEVSSPESPARPASAKESPSVSSAGPVPAAAPREGSTGAAARPGPVNTATPVHRPRRRVWMAIAASLAACAVGALLLGLRPWNRKTGTDPSAQSLAEGSPAALSPEEENRLFQELQRQIEDLRPRLEELSTARRFGDALDLLMDLEVRFSRSTRCVEAIERREDELFEMADAAFRAVEREARECGDPAQAVRIITDATSTFRLLALEERAQRLVSDFESVLGQAQGTAAEESPEVAKTGPAPVLSTGPAVENQPPAREPGSGEPVVAQAVPPARPTSPASANEAETVRRLAQDLLPILEKRRYTNAREPCVQACTQMTDPALRDHLARCLDFLTDAEQFWVQVEQGAQDMVGKSCSFTIRKGAGTIKLRGALQELSGDRFLLKGEGHDYSDRLRSLDVEDAARLGGAATDLGAPVVQRSVGVVCLFDQDMDRAKEWLTTAQDGGQDVTSLLACLDDPTSLPRQLRVVLDGRRLQELLDAVRRAALRGDVTSARRLIEKHADLWQKTPLEKDFRAELDKLGQMEPPGPEDAAARLWERAQQSAKEEDWKRVLFLTQSLMRRFAKTKLYEGNAAAIQNLNAEACIGLARKDAEAADAREARRMPSPARDDVILVRQDGKGEAENLTQAIRSLRKPGVILASAETYSETLTIDRIDGTPEMPFAILGVPGGRTVISSVQTIDNPRPCPDQKTFWFPWAGNPPPGPISQNQKQLQAATALPKDPGTYFFDTPNKRCVVYPYAPAKDEKIVFQFTAFTQGQTLHVRTSKHILIKDVLLERCPGASTFEDDTSNVVLQRVAAFQHGDIHFGGGPVVLKNCILPVVCEFPKTKQILATGCVFRTVSLATTADVAQEALFRDCIFLGGVSCAGDPPARLIFRNCVFFRCSNGLDLASGANVEVTDCIFLDTLRTAVNAPKAGDQTLIRNSCFWQNGSNYGEGVKAGAKCVMADPQVQGWDLGDFRLRDDSPCRGKASDGADIGPRWSAEDWGRWFQFIKRHPKVL